MSSNIIGCFISGPALYHNSSEKEKEISTQKGELFREYIWGENALNKKLESLKHSKYGKDLILVLFQFMLNPIQEELDYLKEIERFRSKEKSIGIPVIINNDNFYNQPEKERQEFIKRTLISKLDLLDSVVKRNKLDTKLSLLKTDLREVLDT
ncbi:hypothetical protein [Psychroserpens jangbogonensis]|uniref:hypothetical protein n=1 Tax=Psychroserpens jangbogonensis TaxID=1484460 RepID=UPI00053D149E|nr:hypothetical protein [Psychroserpens jangbogonensis]